MCWMFLFQCKAVPHFSYTNYTVILVFTKEPYFHELKYITSILLKYFNIRSYYFWKINLRFLIVLISEKKTGR
jgi:hypothetical protein